MICKNCSKDKIDNDFGMLRGKRRDICKECRNLLAREGRKANPQSSREACRKYYDKNVDLFRERRIAFHKANPNWNREYQLAHQSVAQARAEVFKALKRGDIHRPSTCSDCGIECTPHGHHHDYNKPLDVIWLCRKCHGALHRRIRLLQAHVQSDIFDPIHNSVGGGSTNPVAPIA